MSASRIFSRIASLLDVAFASPADGDVLTYNATSGKWVNAASSGGGGGGIGGATGSTDEAVLRADGTGGATAQASLVTIDDSGNITMSGQATIANIAGTLYVKGEVRMFEGIGPILYVGGIGGLNLYGPGYSAFGILKLMSGGILEIGPVSSIGTPASGYVRMANISGEVNVCDSSGNVTVISPHAKDAPADLYEIGPGADEMERKANVYLCVVNWWATTRRKLLDALDLAARLGAPEDSSAAWAEVLTRRGGNRLRCHVVETFSEYETRTGQSLVPPDQNATWWLSAVPAQRWDKVEADRVAAADVAHAKWAAREAAFIPTEQQPDFAEQEPALYTAQPPPDFLA